MSRKHLDLLLAAVLAMAAAGIMLIPGLVGPLRIALGLLLALVLPGYALTVAIFPRQRLGGGELAALSLGLSMCLAVVVGLLLNTTPLGMRPETWGLSLALVTVVASMVAASRRAVNAYAPVRRPALRPQALVVYGLAAGVLATAGVVAVSGALQQPRPGFTQLWVLPAPATQANAVRLGIMNMERSRQDYRLVVRSDGQQLSEWQNLDLNPGQRWEITAVLPATGNVEALLYRLDQPAEVYRRVVLQPGWQGGEERRP